MKGSFVRSISSQGRGASRWRSGFLYCLLAGWLGFVQVWLSVPGVRAEDNDAARSASARSMFEEGLQLADDGKWSDAADRFRRALSLRDSQVIRYNLATALLKQGQLVEASELFRQVLRDPALDATVREETQARLDDLAPRIAKLTIEVEGDRRDTEVTLDQQVIQEVQLGISLPVDPGGHVVRARRADQQLDVQEITLAEGARETVTLRLTSTSIVATPAQAAVSASPVLVVPPPASPKELPRQDQDPRDPQRTKRLWWGIGSAAVVGIAIAVVSIVAASSAGSGSSKKVEGDFEPGSLPVEVPE